MMGYKKKNVMHKMLMACAAIAFLVVMVSVLVMMLLGKETRSSVDEQDTKISSLYCTSISPGDVFFTTKKELLAEHKVKYAFRNNILDKVSFTYVGQYASENDANYALDFLHAKYNIYMGKIEIYQEDLAPTFTLLENEVAINLFMDRKTFTTDTAYFVFLDANEFASIEKLSIDELSGLYEAKGFSCKKSE